MEITFQPRRTRIQLVKYKQIIKLTPKLEAANLSEAETAEDAVVCA